MHINVLRSKNHNREVLVPRGDGEVLVPRGDGEGGLARVWSLFVSRAAAPFSSRLQYAAPTVMGFKCGEEEGGNMAGGLPE